MLHGEGETPTPGSFILGQFDFSIPKSGDLAGMFDYQKFLAGRSLKWRAFAKESRVVPATGLLSNIVQYFLSPVRNWVLKQLSKDLPHREASLAGAILLGVRSNTSRNAGEPFADLGLAHLFAVSGLHVGVLLGIVLLPGKLLKISPWQKFVLLVLILPSYAILTGLPGSVIRAAGLALFAMGCQPMGRRGRSLHFLGLLFWMTTLWQPDQVLDTGVRLSYSAAVGILTVNYLIRDFDLPRNGVKGMLIGGIIVSLAASWFTLPFAAESFGRLSLLSPLANLVAVPAFALGVWIVVLSLASSMVFPALSDSLSALGWLVFRSLAGLVNWISDYSGGGNIAMPAPDFIKVFFWTIFSLIFASTLKLKFRKKISSFFATVIFILTTSAALFLFSRSGSLFSETGPTVWQFDVGQGDCSVVSFPDGWTGVIDTGGHFGFGGREATGPFSRNIFPWLKRYGLHNPEAVLLSHGHLDHTGGSVFLLKECPPIKWYGAGKAHEALLPDTLGLNFSCPGTEEVLHRWNHWELVSIYPPLKLPAHSQENDHSMVLALNFKKVTQYLWSGDLESEGEKHLLESSKWGGPARVWKAGHHGSSTSGSQPFLEALNPELILISCGVGNRYHHPSHDYYVVKGDTVPSVRTDLEGSIQLKFHSNGEIHWKSRERSGLLQALP
ncbi:MAG: DNA internalization-related competence protein ComEC/Rec2 [bacterium]|nr:DNA internalization-related competence protein ComEC/Rec2 [bacterium]